jgi:hypothetical protein
MAKRNKGTAVANPQQVVIQNMGIEVRTIDRSPKDLAKFKQAIQSAENIQMPLRTQLYNLYEDIMLDEHLTSVVDQRRNALFDTSLIFQKDGEEIEDVQRIINSIAFERLCKLILDSKLFGYSLIHCDFTPETGPIIELVPRPHVVPEFGIVVKNPGDSTGIGYMQPPYTNLYIGVGEPKDLGLLLKAIPLVLMKRGNTGDWAKFNEVFGQPLRKGTYNPQDPGSKVQLETALANMGNMSYVVVPDGSNLEIVGNYQSASADTYSKFSDYQNKALSKLIVGQTMTTESGSSLSQSEVHERVADRISYADRRFLLKVLESAVLPLMIAQGVKGASDGNFQFVTEEADVSKKDRLTGDIQIHEKVGKISKEYWSKEYNVQFVDDSDEEEVKPEADPEANPTDDPAPDDKPEKEKPEPGEKPTQKNAAGDGWDWKRALLELKSFFSLAPTRP